MSYALDTLENTLKENTANINLTKEYISRLHKNLEETKNQLTELHEQSNEIKLAIQTLKGETNAK